MASKAENVSVWWRHHDDANNIHHSVVWFELEIRWLLRIDDAEPSSDFHTNHIADLPLWRHHLRIYDFTNRAETYQTGVLSTRWIVSLLRVNTLSPRQNGRHFADDIFKWVFLNENVWFSIKISLKFVHKVPINNFPALVQIMAWRRTGDKPLSEPMMAQFNDAYMRHSAWMS